MKPTSPGPLTQQVAEAGFAILSGVYQPAEVAALLAVLESAPATGPNFRRSRELFAIRHLVHEIPALWPLLDTPALRQLLGELLPGGARLVKAIYFDKPAQSNWLVAWHQDLMINVDQRAELPSFGPWTSKPEGVAVLEGVCTIRLHLDDCGPDNGALKVVPGSHRLGVLPAAALPGLTSAAQVCVVPAGGILLMKPLLLHASGRSSSARPRRVIHLEFAAEALPAPLRWREEQVVAVGPTKPA